MRKLKTKYTTIRDKQVLLDSDLAELYGVETKRINEQLRRNKDRFPPDFCFQLNEYEKEILRSQNATLNKKNGTGKHKKYLKMVLKYLLKMT